MITETNNVNIEEIPGGSVVTCKITEENNIRFVEDPSKMKCMGESRKEAYVPKASLMKPKTTVRIGNWNVRTMYATGKTAQIAREMRNLQINILGISECRWTGSGKVRLVTGETVYYSGREDGMHQSGVAVMISKEGEKLVMEWNPVNERIVMVKDILKISKAYYNTHIRTY